MTNQFSAILSACAGPVAIFTDFDGTLVEIADRPDTIDVPTSLADRLGALKSSLDGAFAIISGRTIANIDSFLSSPALSISGSHGAEQRHLGHQRAASAEHSDSAARIARTLTEQFDGDDRILVEPKPSGVAVHYRAAPERGPVYWHYPHYGNQGAFPGAAVRLGDYKLIEFFEDNHAELYNLRRDLGEKKNLAEAKPEKAAELRALLHAWQKETGARFPAPNPNAGKPGR